jgi:diadenosine tetraphosphate (Ap4A) HIT family hydrolase
MGLLVRLAFGRLWWLLPVRRVAQTRGVLAFDHPAPSWQPHLLLVPKRSIRSVLAARPADAPLVGELLRLALVLAHRRGLHRQGFALLVNGGAYQDVPQLHFHLAGLDDGLRYTLPPQAPTRPPLLRTSNLAAYRHPRPQRAVHLAILPTTTLTWTDLAGPRGEAVGWELLLLAQGLIPRLQLGAAGFTLLASVLPARSSDGFDRSVGFHLVAGGTAPS